MIVLVINKNSVLALAIAGTGLLISMVWPNALRAESIEIPQTFKIAWMRGIIVEDNAKGAVVVKSNDSAKIGVIFTRINGQPVNDAADLISKINSADIATVAITTERSAVSPTPLYVEHWAENLRYSDASGGVRIDGSMYPNEVGFYLESLNGVVIRKAAEVRPILLQIAADTSAFKSMKTRAPTPAEVRADELITARSTDRLPAEVRQSWGPLAVFPGKIWYCIGKDPEQWLQRRRVALGAGYGRSLAVERVTSAKWVERYSIMEIYTQLGTKKWTDRIELQPDGTFRMRTAGLSSFTNLAGRKHLSGAIYFDLGTYPGMPGSGRIRNALTYYAVRDTPMVGLLDLTDERTLGGSQSICQMEEYDEIKTTRFARDLAYMRGQDAMLIESDRSTAVKIAQHQADGERRLSEMRASAMSEFARIPGAIAAAADQRAEIGRLRRATEENASEKRADYGTRPIGGSSSARPEGAFTASRDPVKNSRRWAEGNSAASTGSAGSATTRTVRMVLLAGILPTEADHAGGRNPNCQSNIITATIRIDDRGSNTPVQELFERHRSSFMTKCERLGKISTSPTYVLEEPYSIRFGEYGWNDRRVVLP